MIKYIAFILLHFNILTIAQDPYSALGIEKNANENQIKKAYRALALQYHPDKNPGNKEAEEKFKQISAAYEALLDPQKMRDYNKTYMPSPSPAQEYKPATPTPEEQALKIKTNLSIIYQAIMDENNYLTSATGFMSTFNVALRPEVLALMTKEQAEEAMFLFYFYSFIYWQLAIEGPQKTFDYVIKNAKNSYWIQRLELNLEAIINKMKNAFQAILKDLPATNQNEYLYYAIPEETFKEAPIFLQTIKMKQKFEAAIQERKNNYQRQSKETTQNVNAIKLNLENIHSDFSLVHGLL